MEGSEPIPEGSRNSEDTHLKKTVLSDNSDRLGSGQDHMGKAETSEALKNLGEKKRASILEGFVVDVADLATTQKIVKNQWFVADAKKRGMCQESVRKFCLGNA